MYCIFWQPHHKRLAHCSWETDGKCRSTSLQRGWGSWAGSVWSREALGGDKSIPQPVATRRLSDVGSHALHCCAWWADERLWAEVEGGEVQTSGIFPLRAVRHWSRWPRGCVTPSGLAQRLQPSGLTLLLWAGGWHREILNSLPTWIFLWSNDLLYFSQTLHIRKHIIILPNLLKPFSSNVSSKFLVLTAEVCW